MKILIADDDAQVRALLRLIIEQHGHEVIDAADGEEGLARAFQHKPDAIISDGLMPRMDGFQFLKTVKQDATLKSAPFVFHTSIYTAEQDLELALSLGADALIEKPKSPEEFWNEFTAALDMHAAKEKQPVQARERSEDYLENYAQVVASKLEIKVRELEAAITDLERTKAIAQEGEERYRLLFENNPHPMWVYDLETLAFLAVNDAAIHHYGYSREEFLAMTIKDIRPPEDVPALLKKISAPSKGFDAAGTWRHRKKDGTIFDVEITSHTQFFSGRRAKLILASDVTERRRMEKSILNASTEWRSTFDAMSDAIALLDRDGRILRCNKAMAELIGKTFPEIIGRYCWEVVHGSFGPVNNCPHAAMKKSMRREILEIQFNNRWYVVSAEPFFDGKGDIAGAVHIMSDFTGRKQLEDQIHLAKQDWEDTFNTITDMVTVHDKNYNIIRANKAAEKILGLPFLETNKVKCFEHYHGTECPPAGCPSCQCLVTGKPSTFELYEPHLKMFLEIKSIPRFDTENQLVGLIHVVRDISERKRSEDALKESEIKFRNLVEQSLVGIYIIQDDKFKYVNPRFEEIFGYASEELVDVKGPLDLTHPDDRPVVRANILKRRNGEVKSLRYAFRGLTKANSIIHAEVHGFSTLYNGKPAIIGSLIDITERIVAQDELLRRTEEAVLLRQAGKQLEEINRSKSDFLANMSHELRTPLNAVIGLSQVLLEQTFGPLNPKQTEYLDGVRQSGSHLLSLINEILDLSKIEAGKEQFEPAIFSMPETLRSAFMLVKEKAIKHGIGLSHEIGPEVGLFYADERRVKQVLFNLLSNAVKFTQPGGKVGLNARQDAQALTLTVWDTGVGIPENKRHLIFQSFQQLDSSLSRKHEGTGLGLVLSKRLVEMHGGAISFESREGGGTSFTVTFPVTGDTKVMAPHGLERSRAARQSAGVQAAGKKIMLVEDNQLNMLLAADFLKTRSFEVVEATSGEIALEKAAKERPDIILLDIQMPGIDGFEVLRKLREDPVVKDIPVIVMTALAMKGDEERCRRAGADDYISKPVNLKEMLNKIERISARGAVNE